MASKATKAPTPPLTVDGTPAIGKDAEGEPVTSSPDTVVYYDEFWQGLGAEAKAKGLSLSRGEETTGGRVSKVTFQTFTPPQKDENGVNIGTSLVGEFTWQFTDRPLTAGVYQLALSQLGLNSKPE